MLYDLIHQCVRRMTQAVAADRRPTQRAATLRLEVLEVRETPALTAVSPTAGYPYTSIVKLVMTYPNNQVRIGSGALVDGFHVLTAGHNSYSAANGGWAKSIRVIPQMNGTSHPFGSAWMTYQRTYNSFINFDKSNPGRTATNVRDIGLLTLDRNIGNSTGWMGFGYDNNDARFAAGKTFNTAGYPGAPYDGQKMYYSGGKIAGLSADKQAIQYWQSQITTYGGQSGSPVWEYVSSTNKRTILGVHVAGSGTASSLNFATRITQTIFNDLQRWRQSDSAPRSQAVQFSAVGGLTQAGGWGSVFRAQGADDAVSAAAYKGEATPTTGWTMVAGGPAGKAETLTVSAGPAHQAAAGKDEGKGVNRLDATGWASKPKAEPLQHKVALTKTGRVAGDDNAVVQGLLDVLTAGVFVG
jgi:V8-like Glu-specific endopeptidase